MAGAQDYFSHFSPRAIISTFSEASTKFKAHFGFPSLNPLFYINPYYLRETLNNPRTLHNLLRVFIIIVAYLVLRPHLNTLLRKLSGAPEKREEALKARVAKMKEVERRERKDL